LAEAVVLDPINPPLINGHRDHAGMTLGYRASAPDYEMADWRMRSTTIELLQNPIAAGSAGLAAGGLASVACLLACGLFPVACAVCPALAGVAAGKVIDTIMDLDASTNTDFAVLANDMVAGRLGLAAYEAAVADRQRKVRSAGDGFPDLSGGRTPARGGDGAIERHLDTSANLNTIENLRSHRPAPRREERSWRNHRNRSRAKPNGQWKTAEIPFSATCCQSRTSRRST
jgi:hypothetical protein